MTSTTPKGRRGMDYGQHAGTGVHLHVTDETLTAHEQATLDALIQIDKKFGKKDLTPTQIDKLNQIFDEKAAKKAQGPVQKGRDWTKNIKKQHVSPNWNTNISSNPGYANISMPSTTSSIDTLNAIQSLIRLTAKSAELNASASGQNMTTTVTWDNDGLQRFYALCQKSGAKGTLDPSYDLEILEEQTTEVGDQLSDEFKRGLKAAVAVLLEGKHLEEFLP